jgi:hypothetical protein
VTQLETVRAALAQRARFTRCFVRSDERLYDEFLAQLKAHRVRILEMVSFDEEDSTEPEIASDDAMLYWPVQVHRASAHGWPRVRDPWGAFYEIPAKKATEGVRTPRPARRGSLRAAVASRTSVRQEELAQQEESQ